MYSQIANNKRKTVYLMFAFVAFIALLGWIMGQALSRPSLLMPMIIFAVAYALISYFASAKIALAMSGARRVTRVQAPDLYHVVNTLAITSGIPTPAIYIIDDPAPNAFATGRDPKHASVAVTSGLLERLTKQELMGVIAHELSHINNYDTRVMAIVIMLASIISIISDFFLRISFWGGDDEDSGSNPIFMIIGIASAFIAPIVALILQMAVSRRREYLADASAALLTRYPTGLASALTKIADYKQPMRHASTATAHLFISNPLKAKTLANLFSTHPPIADRIARLNTMDSKV